MRKRLFGVLAVVIAVSVLLTLLLFTRENEIGLSGTELHSGGVPLETTGDSDLLDVSLLDGGIHFGGIKLRFSAKTPELGVAFCTDIYTDGKLTESDAPVIVIDKYDNGEWQFYGNGEYVGMGISPDTFKDYVYHDSDMQEWVRFDSGEPGLYRFTLFFREITENKGTYLLRLTTSPELRSVSFTLEVSNTGKPYNLDKATLQKLNENDSTDAIVEVNLRAADENVKFPIYLSKSSIELYENNGGRLNKVGDFSDGRVMSRIKRVQNCTDDEYYYVSDITGTYMRYGEFVLQELDYDKEYALKMTFLKTRMAPASGILWY